MSLSGMVGISGLQAKRSFVLPAKAGIQFRFGEAQKIRLDSGVRRNDGIEKTNFESTPKNPSASDRGLFNSNSPFEIGLTGGSFGLMSSVKFRRQKTICFAVVTSSRLWSPLLQKFAVK
jgi:hypothetical protein